MLVTIRLNLETRKTYPDIKIEVLICDRFDVETDCRYRGDDLTNLWARGVSPTYLIQMHEKTPVSKL